jgi:hypothetical protein
MFHGPSFGNIFLPKIIYSQFLAGPIAWKNCQIFAWHLFLIASHHCISFNELLSWWFTLASTTQRPSASEQRLWESRAIDEPFGAATRPFTHCLDSHPISRKFLTKMNNDTSIVELDDLDQNDTSESVQDVDQSPPTLPRILQVSTTKRVMIII